MSPIPDDIAKLIRVTPSYANDYQHIIPFFGATSTDKGLGLVTLFCKNGKILDYIEMHKKSWALDNSETENRVRLVGTTVFSSKFHPAKGTRQVTDIAKGLAQLHSLNQCHDSMELVCTSFI